MSTPPRLTKNSEIRRQRRRKAHSCYNHLIAAPLWAKYTVNLGTLLRTCDAVGACMAVPRRPRITEALDKGNRLRPGSTCIHWVNDPASWLEAQRGSSVILAVELADEAIRLADLKPAEPAERTIMLLGNEGSGVPPEGMEFAQYAVEIPMIGIGSSLNVAVAGSLVLYRLAGLLLCGRIMTQFRCSPAVTARQDGSIHEERFHR